MRLGEASRKRSKGKKKDRHGKHKSNKHEHQKVEKDVKSGV